MIKLMLIVYLYLVLQMCCVWLASRFLKNPSVVDVSWSIGLMMAGLIYLYSQPNTLRISIIAILLVVWGLRLAGYLWYSRVRKGHVDKRYTEMGNGWKINKSLGFFLNFQLQGILIFVVSIVFLFISKTAAANFSLLDYIAFGVVLIGIFGESLADLQLQRFKAGNKGKVCNVGLWRYSRHPNYFFDWLTWCGFALFAEDFAFGCIGWISPLLMYLIFTRVTGPMTERGSIQSRGQAFVDYQKQTSMFFPWFKRSTTSG
jgi:steroid 5-alpha reductase family enzyme